MPSRNVVLLAICQALGQAAAPLVLLAGGIVGSSLAPSRTISTLAVTASVVGTAVFTLPAALIMKRFGRRRGFVAASLVASLASLSAALAISAGSFALFCLTTFVLGGCLAFGQQYRFAAAESAEAPAVGRAVSFVFLGGVVAGYLGPQVATLGRDLLASGTYTGSFVVMAALQALVAVLLLSYRQTAAPTGVTAGMDINTERPLRAVAAQPSYRLAVWCSVVAYGAMSFIMTGTPISMVVIDGAPLAEATTVIQAHIMAMYLPSVFTGLLVDRLGTRRMQMLGAISILLGVAAALPGHHMGNYLLALILLGVGWNLLFVGSTVLLTTTYQPGERFKAQGFNDLCVFSVQAALSLAAGWFIYQAGWEVVNLLTVPFLLATLLVLWRGFPGRDRAEAQS